MTDEQGFLNACLSEPDHDLPKLVFADWLEEQGRTKEAWRIRQYLREYRPRWHEAVGQWSGDRPQRVNHLKPIRQVFRSRNDALWRMVCLTQLEILNARYPLHLEQARWPRGWGPQRYAQTLSEAKCRVLLDACGPIAGLDLAREAAEQAVVVAASHWDHICASQAAERLARSILASAGDGSQPLQHAVNATRQAVLYGVLTAGAKDAEMIRQITQNFWTYVFATKPPW